MWEVSVLSFFHTLTGFSVRRRRIWLCDSFCSTWNTPKIIHVRFDDIIYESVRPSVCQSVRLSCTNLWQVCAGLSVSGSGLFDLASVKLRMMMMLSDLEEGVCSKRLQASVISFSSSQTGDCKRCDCSQRSSCLIWCVRRKRLSAKFQQFGSKWKTDPYTCHKPGRGLHRNQDEELLLVSAAAANLGSSLLNLAEAAAECVTGDRKLWRWQVFIPSVLQPTHTQEVHVTMKFTLKQSHKM